jgi:hypothetical protein
MLRFLSVGAMLFAVASSVAASEHYVEIWNPPEARLAQPAGKYKPKSGKTALLSRNMAKAAPRRIADPLAKASQAKHTGGDVPKKAASPRFIDIPRIVTPEGNVLRVNDDRTPVYLMRG